MNIRHISKRNNYLSIIIVYIWLLFSCIFIINAFFESNLLDALSPIIQDTLQANEAIKQQEYEEALQLISWNTSEDYYNRGTIQALIAYKNALESSISWLENAQISVAEAQQNFDIAKKLSDSETIKNAISDNEKTIASLSTVVDIKTCYGIGQTIITSIDEVNTVIKSTKETLNQEEGYINRSISSLSADCYEKLRSIVDSSKEQVGILQLQMQKNTSQYTSDFSDKIENPTLCIQIPYENIIPSLIKGRQGLELYQQQHQNTINALKSKDSESIKELCDQSKNDAQINQQIESSVQELLQKLEDNKQENQEQKRASNEVQYKDFLNEDEKKALQEMQTINQWRINTMLDIRWKGNYDPERYINDMFNQFYGNSGDFINLHK